MNSPPAPEEPPARLPWPSILVGGAILGGLAFDFVSDSSRPDALFTVIGGPLVAIAILTILWCAKLLRDHGTTIQPHRAATSLVTDGPYAHSRNPIYAAYVVLVFGLGLVLGSWTVSLLAPLVAVALHFMSVLPEERHLRKKFGVEYERWAAETPRWLFI